MAAIQYAIHGGKLMQCTAQNLREVAQGYTACRKRQRDGSESRDRPCAAGVQIAQRVVGGDAAHQPGVCNDFTQDIHALHDRPRYRERYRIVAIGQTMPGIRFDQCAQRFTQHIRTYLRATAAAGFLVGFICQFR